MVGLEGAGQREAEVLSLRIAQLSQLDAEGLQVAGRDLLVQLLGQHVDADRVLAGVGPEVNLSENLVGEGAAHHEG